MFLYDCCYSVFTNHAFRKSVFYSLLFVMTLLTIHDILDLCKQYKYDDKKAEMSIVFNDTMTFPNMTFV
uniref:Uncharacterized protein n=1 Tax=Ditylenchus dipsaci TaxID=166011 RepID=A0A915D1Z4_9BILA